MTDTTLDYDDHDIDDDDDNPQVAQISKRDLAALRKAAKRAGSLEKELADFRRERAIRQAGLTDLSDRQVQALARLADEETPEAFKALATELGFVQPPADEQVPDDEIAGHEQVVAAANGAGPVASRSLGPEEAATWPQDKIMRFTRDHPELAELVMRGETIDVPAGFN